MTSSSTPQRALLIWQVLIAKARDRQTIPYGILAYTIGLKPGAHRAIGLYLDPIERYCRDNSLPVLTIIVVNLQTGRPSYVPEGLDEDAEWERVFDRKWFAQMPPTIDELTNVPE